jgi:hypothetical protein
MKAKAEEHRLLTPEYAYLTDLKHRRADDNWKGLRTAKAHSALNTLAGIAPIPAAAARRLSRQPTRRVWLDGARPIWRR